MKAHVRLSDDWMIGAVVAAAGALRVAIQLASGRAWDAGGTIALVMLVLGSLQLMWALRQRS